MRVLLATLMLMTMSGILQAQEFRGAWVASVWNLNFPSKAGVSEEQMKREIISMLDTARRSGLNALMVQVRPEGDALYPSRLEPWSRYLTGRQGSSPGFDPLQFFIDEGKKRGIGIHAWFNPYRASVNTKNPRHAAHVSNRFPSHAKRVGNLLWMDPGSPQVQDHVVEVVRDVVRRYDIAGVHLDDYFYPYPAHGKVVNFPDSATYNAYRAKGGKLSLADWRRQNVNTLVSRLHTMIKQEKPGCLFGVSPFGIYTRGQPSTVKAGLDQYHQLYADPVLWMKQGWVDYLAPQLYWKNNGPQCFTELLKWWRNPSVNPRGIPIYPGVALDRLGGTHKWPASEIAVQLQSERSIGPRPKGGVIFYNIKQLQDDLRGVRAIVTR